MPGASESQQYIAFCKGKVEFFLVLTAPLMASIFPLLWNDPHLEPEQENFIVADQITERLQIPKMLFCKL